MEEFVLINQAANKSIWEANLTSGLTIVVSGSFSGAINLEKKEGNSWQNFQVTPVGGGSPTNTINAVGSWVSDATGLHTIRFSAQSSFGGEAYIYVSDQKIYQSEVQVSTSGSEVVPPNANRSYVQIINDSDLPIYLYFGANAQVNKGTRLNPEGGSVVFEDILSRSRITAIHAGIGNKRLLVTEIY